MSDIKVLALDLDGTLTNDQKLVTPRTRAALDAAIAKGVTVVLASGRPTAGIQPLAEELGLDKKGGCTARSWIAAPAKRWWKRRWTLPLCPSCAPLPPRRILPS